MTTPEEKHEFNEDQKKRRLYYETEGRHLSRVEDELKKLNNSLGFLIDMIQQWMEDEEKRREEEYRRSSYGMYDPFKHRTQRGPSDSGDRWSEWASDKMRREPYRNPFKQTKQDWERQWDQTPPPSNPDEDSGTES